jgi:hypothetical protein
MLRAGDRADRKPARLNRPDDFSDFPLTGGSVHDYEHAWILDL